MAGRGRGGKTGTFTAEQLAMLGCSKDLPVQSAPPPTFPPVLNKPIALETTDAESYQLQWKEKFLNRMRDSPYYIVSATGHEKPKTEIKDWRERALEGMKPKKEPEFNYRFMPRELNISSRKRHAAADNRTKLVAKKKTNIEDKLKLLEQKELKSGGGDNDNDEVKKESDSEHEDDNEQDPEAALDDEMDEENDYGNSYFDNGEAYNEDEDNLDDGPVY